VSPAFLGIYCRQKFLKTRIVVERIKLWVEPKKRGSERDVGPSGVVGWPDRHSPFNYS
jgi:hypothetical protein